MIKPDLSKLKDIDVNALSHEKREALFGLLSQYQKVESVGSFEMWCKFNGFVPAKHHRLIISELEALERGEFNRLMLCFPPGSAKSTYASVLFPPWYLGRHPKHCVMGISHTAELADRFGRKVRNFVGADDYKDIFGVGLSSDSTAAGRWETSAGGEYYAAGIGGNITGRRLDLGIIDDPVRNREDADSDIVQERQWEWYKSDFLTRMKPNAKQIVIMTRWHENDLGGRILEREADKWRVVEVPMEARENDPLGRKEGEYLWPEWYTQEMIDTAKEDSRSWFALYQQQPRPIAGAEFKRDWMNFYTHVSPREMTKIMCVDPANGKRVNNDYTCIWVIGLGTDGNYYVLDIVRDKLNLTERADTVFRLHKKWRPSQVRYERYSMQADVEYLKQEMDRRSYRFALMEVGGSTSKIDRIRRLVPLFERGRFWFPSAHEYTDYKGKTEDMVHKFIESELTAFPVSKHDDMLDSLARIAEPNIHLPWPKKEEDYLPKEESWEPFDAVMGY